MQFYSPGLVLTRSWSLKGSFHPSPSSFSPLIPDYLQAQIRAANTHRVFSCSSLQAHGPWTAATGLCCCTPWQRAALAIKKGKIFTGCSVCCAWGWLETPSTCSWQWKLTPSAWWEKLPCLEPLLRLLSHSQPHISDPLSMISGLLTQQLGEEGGREWPSARHLVTVCDNAAVSS